MEALKDLKWLIVILIGLWVVWFFTGGTKHFEAIKKPFVKPAAPLDTGELYGPK